MRSFTTLDLQYAHRFYGFKGEAQYLHGHTGILTLEVEGTVNMGVNMGLLPTKGLTLPMMSFGGSGILVNCVAVAILLRIDWENRQMMRGRRP